MIMKNFEIPNHHGSLYNKKVWLQQLDKGRGSVFAPHVRVTNAKKSLLLSK